MGGNCQKVTLALTFDGCLFVLSMSTRLETRVQWAGDRSDSIEDPEAARMRCSWKVERNQESWPWKLIGPARRCGVQGSGVLGSSRPPAQPAIAATEASSTPPTTCVLCLLRPKELADGQPFSETLECWPFVSFDSLFETLEGVSLES